MLTFPFDRHLSMCIKNHKMRFADDYDGYTRIHVNEIKNNAFNCWTKMFSPKTLMLALRLLCRYVPCTCHDWCNLYSFLLEYTLLVIPSISLARLRVCGYSHRGERIRTFSHTGAAVRACCLKSGWHNSFVHLAQWANKRCCKQNHNRII